MKAELARTSVQLGNAIRNARRARNRSQQDLADQTHLRQATISAMERGEGGTVQNILKVIAALDLELLVQPRSKTSPDQIEEIF